MGRMAGRWGAGAAAALMVGSLLVATPAQAADPATYQGTITDADTETPVAGACVALFRSPMAAETEACTDTEGRYTITDAVVGAVYRLRVRADGYADRWWANGVDYVSAAGIPPAGSTTPITVNLAITQHAGTLRGRITRQDGSPAPLATVRVYPAGQDSSIRAYTDVNGEYRLDHLPTGDYQIWATGAGYPEQWAPGKTTRDEAGTYSVTAGTETVVDEQFIAKSPMPALYFGTMTGTVLALNTGAPVADACVTVYRLDWATAAVTCTDSTGTYRVRLPAGNGRYRVLVRHQGDPDTWAPTASTYDVASTYYVWADATVTANAAVGGPPYGATIRGRIIDYTGTAPTERVDVRATAVDGPWRVTVIAQPDGSYEFSRLPVGRYRLSAVVQRTVEPNTYFYVTQWFPQQGKVEGAETVTVGSGEVLTRDETLIAPARLDITLVDDVTGAPVTTACVHAGWEPQCGSADGTYHFTRIWTETASALATASPHYFEGRAEGIPVVAGQTTAHTMRLRPAGAITATVARVADGSIPRTCTHAVPVAFASQWLNEFNNTFCNIDGQGNVLDTITLGPLAAGPYQIFVDPAEPWGAQWLGASGGTGDRRAAAKISVRVRETVTAPVVKLDRAGAIAGTLRDRATGAPLLGYVRPFGMTSGLMMVCTNLPHYTDCSEADGGYRLDRLGPYAWPVEFVAAGHASEWSGGATDRFRAKPIPVRAGEVTRLDASLGPEGKIGTLNLGPNAPAYWSATAFNAETGDYAGSAVYHNPPVIGGLNTAPIFIQYDDYTPGVEPCWYYRTTRPAQGTRRPLVSSIVKVTAGQTVDGIALIPGETCRRAAPRLLSDPLPRRPAPPTALLPRAEQPGLAASPSSLYVAPDLAQAPGEPLSIPRSHSSWGWELTRSAGAWFLRLTQTATARP